MPIQIVRNDITKMHVDAIVTTGNKYLRAGSGVNGAIHKAAGPMLEIAAQQLGGCAVGEAKITQGFNLPCRYVIHTVSPIWHGTGSDKQLLAACYSESLKLAVAQHCRSIAFPLIASGAHGCPKTEAMHIATDAINQFLLQHVPDNDLMVYLVVFTKESLLVGSKLYADIKQYIDDCYVEEHWDLRRESLRARRAAEAYNWEDESDAICTAPMADALPMPSAAWQPSTLEDALNQIDESFSQMIQRLIKERGMKNADCYKKANIDKKLFSKIINNVHYKPKKTTALALAVALELPLDETKELLMKAGLALSHSEKFDIIVEFFIMKGNYDIFEINEMLYEFDQPLLGGVLA